MSKLNSKSKVQSLSLVPSTTRYYQTPPYIVTEDQKKEHETKIQQPHTMIFPKKNGTDFMHLKEMPSNVKQVIITYSKNQQIYDTNLNISQLSATEKFLLEIIYASLPPIWQE